MMLDSPTLARPHTAGGQTVWSLDAWAAISPAAAFRYIAARPSSRGTWLAFRRPLFIALVLACGISMLSAGVVTPRIALSVFVYWAYVPLTEMLTVAAVTWRMKTRPPMATVIDRFFIGHAPSTLLLLGLVGILTSLPFDLWWTMLTGPLLWAFAIVIVWSAYVDFCFFRDALQMRPGLAAVALVAQRMLTWTLVFVVFAVVAPSVRVIAWELTEAFLEVMK